MEVKKMKSIIISSNCSGGGKSTFTLALMKALINRKHDVQGYKVGPDYIDTAFHTHVCKKASRNLDLFIMGEEGVKTSYSKGKGDIGIIEGVMGIYDGLGYDSEYSTYHLSKVLKLPIILLITPKAQSNTLCAELMGILNYEKANIKGVVLNNISKEFYKLLKKLIKKNTPLKVFGFIPKEEGIILKSRHLGLVQSSEIEDLDKKINLPASLLEAHVNVEEIIDCLEETTEYTCKNVNASNKTLKIGYAYDKAFSFYYKDNLELFEEVGELIPFSPLKDKKLPEDIDFLYIGGGYPEVFEKELSGNQELLSDIRYKLEKGLPTFAECGGLMYLTKGSDTNNLVGFFDGIYKMTDKLVNFGYAKLKVHPRGLHGWNVFPTGLEINCHEFHKSYVELKEETVFTLSKDFYEEKKWECGYIKKNVIACYAHVHFYGNIEFFNSLIKLAKEYKRGESNNG
jgi:cobyrinic acid a,c-diamide synthase